jgi:fucose 4-O-acetylase-like acetyltransferase
VTASGERLDGFGWLFMILGVGMLANALWMLAGPMHWYHELPAGVPNTGPFNPHFVRDIGCAFLTVGIALIWAARSERVRLPLAVIACVFLSAHALLHIYDTAVGNLPSDHWYLDLAGVYLPAIVLGVAVARLYRSDRADALHPG